MFRMETFFLSDDDGGGAGTRPGTIGVGVQDCCLTDNCHGKPLVGITSVISFLTEYK